MGQLGAQRGLPGAAVDALAQRAQDSTPGAATAMPRLLGRAARSHAGDLQHIGVAAYQGGLLGLALELLDQAIALSLSDPRAPFHVNRGLVLLGLRRFASARAELEQALALDPGHVEALLNLGSALGELGRPADAIAAYERALAVRPDLSLAYYNLANTRNALGQRAEAIAHYERALVLRPDYAKALANLGNVLADLGRRDEAIARYEQALLVRPDYVQALSNLGNALKEQGILDAAIVRYEQALCGAPAAAAILTNLGCALTDQGRPEAAIACHELALAVQPDHAQAHCNLLMGLHYSEKFDSAAILVRARRFAAVCACPTQAATAPRQEGASRRLRIGYVSADFGNHPVGYFLAAVLPAHDRNAVEVVCYSNRVLEDGMSQHLRRYSDHWRNIAGQSDAEAVRLIAQDGIDILVDLSGHTAGNRLPLFARRAAPVQVTWLGYFGTTGVPAIDYILADRFVVPEGEEAYFSETVWRLPGCYLCYAPHRLDLAVAPAPLLRQGFVTFGCFNNRAKLGSETLELWATILSRVPDARLFLKTKALTEASARQGMLTFFASRGIAPQRLQLEGFAPLDEVLAAYGRVDIALDPFPFGGCTTTAEALWMGVPVVTLGGARWTGRMGQSILAALGLSAWVAVDAQAYADLAVALAGAADVLAATRMSLRCRVEESSFCDAPAFALQLESAYRGMWLARTSQAQHPIEHANGLLK